MVLRAVWAADLAIQVLLIVGAWGITSMDLYAGYRDARQPLIYLTLGVLAAGVPLGYFTRNQVYKAHWHAHAVTPRGYALGNAALAGALELVTAGSVLAVLVVGEAVPLILPAIVSIGVYALNFPHGKPMRSTPPRV